MDFNKLQKTLYDIEPTDTKEELRKLQESASRSSVPDSQSENFLVDTVSVVEGSLAMDRDYSIYDFAALAGIRLDESQRDGDYAKGNVPTPKAKGGRTDHPLDKKLVGSYEHDDDVEEGFTDELKRGYKNPQNFKKAFGIGGKGNPAGKKDTAPKKRAEPRTNSQLSSKIEKYSGQLEIILNNRELTAEFERFLNTNAPRRESVSAQNKNSIKESLLKALDQYEKKTKR